MASALPRGWPSEPRVLVIDDDEDLCERIAEELSHRGYDVETAHNVREAVVKVGESPFDLAITDLRMPDMSGAEAIGLLRAMAPEMRFLVATGYSLIDAKVACMKAGVADFIRKPFAIVELVALIEGKCPTVPIYR